MTLASATVKSGTHGPPGSPHDRQHRPVNRSAGFLVPGAAHADPDPHPQRRPAPLRHRAGFHRRAVRPHPLHPVGGRAELPGPAPRHPLLGVLPDRSPVGGRRHGPAVRAGARPRPAAQPESADALAGPGAGDHSVGDARGGRRHHVAARLQPGRGGAQRDHPRSRPRRRPGLAHRTRHRPARRDRRGRLGRHAADHRRPAGRAAEHPARTPRGRRAGRGGRLAPLPYRHLARAQTRRALHHRAQLHLELQLLRPGLRTDQRRTRRPYPAADALRLRRGIPLRTVRLRRGDGLRDGRGDLRDPRRVSRRPTRGGEDR